MEQQVALVDALETQHAAATGEDIRDVEACTMNKYDFVQFREETLKTVLMQAVLLCGECS